MTFYPEGQFDSSAFAQKIVIVPSVSLANLPQLSVDLLITSLALRRVGWIGKGDTVAPFAGLGEHGEVVTGGLEVYGSEEGVYVIQQRSPTLKTMKDQQVELLRSFAQSNGFTFVLVLTSLDAANQDDAQLLTPHQQITPPSTASHPILDRLRTLPALSLSLASDRISSSVPKGSVTSSYPPFLPSAGLTRRLLASLRTTQILHGCLTVWCVEGDNREDAYALTARVLHTLDLTSIEIKEPKSWKGLFGVSQGWSGGLGSDSELYG